MVSGRRVRPTFGWRRLLQEFCQQRSDFIAQLPTVHQHVECAVLQQELAALEALREGLANSLLNDTGSREANQCIRLRDVDVARVRYLVLV